MFSLGQLVLLSRGGRYPMHPLRLRAAHIAVELRELQTQLATADHTPEQVVQDQSTLELIRELKSAVDAMRQILWKYIDTSVAGCPKQADAALLNSATAMLRSLNAQNVHSSEADASFIETVSAVVEKYSHSKDRAA